MIITLMRHGKVAGPPALYGSTDIPCSEEGGADMALQFGSLVKPDQIISSPMRRCREFAEAVSEQQQIPLTIEHQLKELCFGDWDGVPFDHLQSNWADVEAYFLNPKEHTPPNGESTAELYQRISEVWEGIVNQWTNNETVSSSEKTHLVIICHGAVIRMIIAHVMQMDHLAPQWFSYLDIRYASLTKIEVNTYQGKTWCRLNQIGSKVDNTIAANSTQS